MEEQRIRKLEKSKSSRKPKEVNDSKNDTKISKTPLIDSLNTDNSKMEEIGESSLFLSSFNAYYDDEEDDYSDVELKEINPDYKGFR